MSSHEEQAIGGKFDENGDEIKCEGVCNRCGVTSEVTWMAIYVLGLSLLAGFIFIPLFIAGCVMAVKNWKLYVTRKGIYYTRPTYCFGLCFTHWFIPLEDVEDIYIAPGTTHTIWVKMDPGKINEYLHWCYRPLCVQLNCLILGNVQNSEDFVAAVKREKEAN